MDRIANIESTDEGFEIGGLDINIAPAGGSDAVGGLICAAGRAIIIIWTIARE